MTASANTEASETTTSAIAKAQPVSSRMNAYKSDSRPFVWPAEASDSVSKAMHARKVLNKVHQRA